MKLKNKISSSNFVGSSIQWVVLVFHSCGANVENLWN